jgi:hypothetical protein
MVPTADLIMFGIQAALRLGDQYRRGFADATLNLALVLPLPNFPNQPDVASARGFYLGPDGLQFQDGFINEFVDLGVRTRDLLAKNALTPQESTALMRAFSTHYAMAKAQKNALFRPDSALQGVTADEVNALLAIRQWREGQDPNPSLLRRMAGSLVNVAIDYLQGMPGVVSQTGARGKAIHGFLEGIESITFAEAGSQEIISGLFSAALETVRDHPELVVHGEHSRELVKQAASGLYEDTQKFLKNGTQRQKDSVGDWANLVFRGLLNTAGRLVVEQPQKFLGTPGGGLAEELIQRVGKAVLSTVIDDQFVNFERLFTPQAVDQLVKAALTAVGNHPEILGVNNDGIRNIVTELAKELSQSTLQLGPDFLLEAARLVIEKTGENLEQLMPDGVAGPARNLLIVGLRETLKQLAAPAPAGAIWTLQFGPEEAKKVARVVVDSVVGNPAWVVATAGVSTTLGDVTKAVLDTLRTIAPADRISRSTAVAMLSSALKAATQRLEFTKVDQNAMLVAQAIDAVLSPLVSPGADPSVSWALLRDEVVQRLVEVTFEKLARFGVSVTQIQKLRTTMGTFVHTVAQSGKFSVDDFAGALETALA